MVGLTEDEAKVRTFRNLVPAFQVRNQAIETEIAALVREQAEKERSIEEMVEFLKQHGQQPLSIADWKRTGGM